MRRLILVATILVACSFGKTACAAPAGLDACNVVWKTPGQSSSDSMPLGNGQLGINLWVEENGDLLFYLGRNDTHSEIGQLCKAGMVRVSFLPNPFRTGTSFREELKLRDGLCEIVAADVRLKVFVDAEHPVVHVLGESATPLAVTVKIETWREAPQKPRGPVALWAMANSPEPLVQAADIFPPAPRRDAVAWYHRNENAPAFEASVKLQSLESIRNTLPDTLVRRTFGGWVTAEGFEAKDNRTLTTPAPVKVFDIRVASPCAQTVTADDWLAMADAAAKRSPDAGTALARTAAYWRSVWNQSWVICDQSNSAPVPSNQQPLRVGPTPGVAPAVEISGATVTGRVLSAGEIAAAARNSPPPTTAREGVAMPALTDSMTLQAWVKWVAKSPAPVIEKCSPGQQDGFSLGVHGNGAIRFNLGNRSLFTYSGVVQQGKWQHMAATYDAGTAVMSIYSDGVLVSRMGSENMTVGRAYTLQRYMQVCAGRGPYPIKFNGSLFTVDPTPMGVNASPDFRKWGEGFWWQNTRHPIHTMLPAGDFELTMPLFDLYESFRPHYEARTKLFHGAEGCHFPETIEPWGTYGNDDYGWNRQDLKPGEVVNHWMRYSWNESLELLSLMLDYVEYTGDERFLQERLLPMATSALKFFDTRFKKDAGGRIVLNPTQMLETYQDEVVNDTPTVAGLIAVTTRLCALPAASTSARQRQFFERMKAASPVLPMETVMRGGREIRRISPAAKHSVKTYNNENGDLYPVYPYHLYGMGLPDLQLARDTYATRHVRGIHNGWAYDGINAARLGQTDDAAAEVLVRIGNANGLYRWPATWGPNCDWLPDMDHGANLMNIIHAMLLQTAGNKILLLPTWPKDWDVSFKLHAPLKTTVECVYKRGRLETLLVTPAVRAKDIILPDMLKPADQPGQVLPPKLAALLREPVTKFFTVERSAAGVWTTGHADSFYAKTISSNEPCFVTANGAFVAQMVPDGSLRQACVFNGDTIRNGEKRASGGWVTWKRGVAKAPVFQIKLRDKTITPSVEWPVKTSFLLNAIPTAEYSGPGLTAKVIACAPISADGQQRPRGVIWAVLLRNMSSAPFEGAVSLSGGRGMVVKEFEPNACFSLPPGGEAWYAARLAMMNDHAAFDALSSRDAVAWLADTCAYWRRVTGVLEMPDDPVVAELFMRCTVLALQSGVFNERAQTVGILYGLSPFSGFDNLRDNYYSILPAAQRDPSYLRPFIAWFNRYSTHPPTAKYPQDVLHSLGNTLNASMLAGMYYQATGDRQFFADNLDLVKALCATIDAVLATRKEGSPWLFGSEYISDGRSLGDYHTGSNVCLWRSLRWLAEILEDAGGNARAATRYRDIAAKVKADLDRRNIIPNGPFGAQYVEGTDADGIVPVMIHDGEESDTTLMPAYGYCAVDAPAYQNFMRFAASVQNVAYCPETRGIIWETYGPHAKIKPMGPPTADATFPGYVTALAGCLDPESLRGTNGTLAEIRRLTDVNGSFWWWPYGSGRNTRHGQGLRRSPFECGWAEGEFAVLFQSNFLGIHYDAPRRTLTFKPLPAIGDFEWTDFPIGFDHFTVSYKQGVARVTNLTNHPVTVILGNAAPVMVLPAKTVQGKI